ncbi:hypothetical protein T552_02367 [Pneumocystis carinii B80]|uniref:Wings apart-like protein C-terminal domain-containing protein n=1 Tax=Pneumocystis carinii (strain B80) TaxID=1408658 RepID=A0A0W4ZG69_PNEC8|nr:hypothetical protein T552_02367 [Pneumocystis carinii B80]KTW27388.1 hypothetical protein T552_02367 [Pneumocystis carinii B80]
MQIDTEFHEDDQLYINNHLNLKYEKLESQLSNNSSTKRYINQDNKDNLLLPQTNMENINIIENNIEKETGNHELMSSAPIKINSPKKSKKSINSKNKHYLDTKEITSEKISNKKATFDTKHAQSLFEPKKSSNKISTKSPRTPNKNTNNTSPSSENIYQQNNAWNFLNDFDNSPLRTPKSQRIIDSLEHDKFKSPSHIETPKSKEISIKMFSPILTNEDYKHPKTPQNLYIYNNLVDTFSDIQNTYAKQRSFIAEPANDTKNDIFSSYNANPKNYLNDELNLEDTESYALNIKSVHELRESGINKKSLDEIQYLMDGLNKYNSLKLRQSCYIELAKKINETEFSRNFRSGNFIHQLLEISKEDTDMIILYCTLFILYLLLQDKKSAYALVSDDITFEIIFLGLSYDENIESYNSKNHKTNNYMKDSLIDLIKTVKFSTVHSEYSNKSSCCILSINAIKSIAFLPTWETLNYLEKMESFGCISSLYDIIDRISNNDNSEEFYLIETIVRSIEQCALITCSNTHIKRISTIITLLTSSLFHNFKKKYKYDIFQSCLRLLINLTNNSSSICDEVAYPKFIQTLTNIIISKKDSLDIDQSSDNTLLTLGLLINIIEKGSKISYISEEYDTGNTFISLVTIDELVNTFTRWREYSYNTETNVAAGYLAILLAHLSLKNSDSGNMFLSKYIREKLPNNSYNIIIEFLHEFAQFNMEIEKKAAETFRIKWSSIASEIQKISEVLHELESKLIISK